MKAADAVCRSADGRQEGVEAVDGGTFWNVRP